MRFSVWFNILVFVALFAGNLLHAQNGFPRQDFASIQWHSLNGPMGAGSINEIVVDSTTGDVFSATNHGVYRLPKNGVKWSRLPVDSMRFLCLLLSRSRVLYAGSFDSGLFRSSDMGVTWERVTSLPALQIAALAEDEQGRLYAASDDVYMSDAGVGNWQRLDACPELDVKLYGLNFGPYINGADPTIGATLTKDSIRTLLRVVAPYTRWVRTFGCNGGLQHVGHLAHDLGMKTAIGAWLEGDDSRSDTLQIDSLIAMANRGEVDIAIVGSETIYRRDSLSALMQKEWVSKLIEWIEYVRASIPDTIPVTTVDTYQSWIAHPELVLAADIVMANVYPFWHPEPVENAITVLDGAYRALTSASGDKEVCIAETGWPTCGDAFRGVAFPSLTNAITYLRGVRSWAVNNEVPVFYFSAFDEDWKARRSGYAHDSCWGLWNDDLTLKDSMEVLVPRDRLGMVRSVDSSWCGGSGFPSVHLSQVPSYGGFSDLEGYVRHVDPAAYVVAVYIKCSELWYTKPYYGQTTTPIGTNCTFRCDVSTGGVDQLATRYTVFLLEAGVSPEIASGCQEIPEAMWEKAVAWTEYEREICGAFKSLLVRPTQLLAGATGNAPGTAGAGLFMTTDLGVHWSRPTKLPWDVNAIVSFDETSKIFIGGHDGLFSSASGDIWIDISEGMINPGVTDLLQPTGSTILVASGSGVALLDTGTKVWVNGSLAAEAVSLVMDAAGFIYAGSKAQGVFRTEVSLTSVDGHHSPGVAGQTTLDPVFPNPADGLVHVRIRTATTVSACVTIHDLLGRRMDASFQGVLPAGSEVMSWDVGTWPAGIYLCRVVTGTTVLSRIFVVR